MKSDMPKIIFISWFSFSSRSDNLAYYLGAPSYHIRFFKKKRKIYAILKYLLASIKTWILLRQGQPDIIFVMNPPIFAVAAVWIYCVLKKSQYVVDTHSAAFTAKRWAFFLWLYRFLAKRALMSLLHNEPLRKRVASWGAPAMTLEDGPPRLETSGIFPFRKGFNVVMVSSFGGDEPLDEVIKAAESLPDVNFYITGKIDWAPKEILAHHPQNVIFTNYLKTEDFNALLIGCDVVISLTKNDNTMQCGAFEALEAGRPIITSDWPVLRAYFPKGTIHIDNSASSLLKAIEEIRHHHCQYLEEITSLRGHLREIWRNKFSFLLDILQGKDASP